MKKTGILIIAFFYYNNVVGQFWQGTGNAACPSPQCVGVGTNFMGTSAGNNILVRFGTAGTESFRMMNNGLVPTTFAAGAINSSQFVGIGLNASQTPWSRLHIGVPSGPAATQAYGGYRDWMGEGVTIQRKDDQLFMGHYKTFC